MNQAEEDIEFTPPAKTPRGRLMDRGCGAIFFLTSKGTVKGKEKQRGKHLAEQLLPKKEK